MYNNNVRIVKSRGRFVCRYQKYVQKNSFAARGNNKCDGKLVMYLQTQRILTYDRNRTIFFYCCLVIRQQAISKKWSLWQCGTGCPGKRLCRTTKSVVCVTMNDVKLSLPVPHLKCGLALTSDNPYTRKVKIKRFLSGECLLHARSKNWTPIESLLTKNVVCEI